MELTWLGKQAFSLASDGVTGLINPEKGISAAKNDFVVLTDSDKTLYNPVLLKNTGYTVDWPGEYEVQKNLVVGVELPDNTEGAIHTMMSITSVDRITVAHLGMLTIMPDSKKLEKLGTVHILILPLSGLTIDQHISIIDIISPAVVVPIDLDGREKTFEALLKHYGKLDRETQNSIKMPKPESIPETPVITLLAAKA